MVAHGVEKKAHHDSSLSHDMAEIKAHEAETTHEYICLYIY